MSIYPRPTFRCALSNAHYETAQFNLTRSTTFVSIFRSLELERRDKARKRLEKDPALNRTKLPQEAADRCMLDLVAARQRAEALQVSCPHPTIANYLLFGVCARIAFAISSEPFSARRKMTFFDSVLRGCWRRRGPSCRSICATRT